MEDKNVDWIQAVQKKAQLQILKKMLINLRIS